MSETNCSIEFEAWWKDAEVRGRIFTVGFQEYAAIVWNAAWEARKVAESFEEAEGSTNR